MTVDAQDIRRRARLALITRAAGHDTHPGGEQLHHYWTRGPGLARWAESPHPWQALHDALEEALRKNGRMVSPEMLNRMVSAWHFEVFHQHTGSDAYRVEHGGRPRGKRIGLG